MTNDEFLGVGNLIRHWSYVIDGSGRSLLGSSDSLFPAPNDK